MKKTAAIFDMDGTLIDSGPIWQEILQDVPNQFGLSISDEDFALMYTMTSEATDAFLQEKHRSASAAKGTFMQLKQEIDAATHKAYAHTVQAKPGIAAYLETLAREGAALCVATLTPESFARQALTRLGLMPYFSFIITGDDVGADKRSPAIFLEACRRMGSVPAHTWVFEDSLTAAKTAHCAGFLVAAVYDRHQSYDFAEIVPYARITLRDYRDVLALV